MVARLTNLGLRTKNISRSQGRQISLFSSIELKFFVIERESDIPWRIFLAGHLERH